MDRRELYKQKIDALFKEWRSKMSVLEEKAEKASSSMRADIVRDINELRERKGVVQDKWVELQKASGDAWESVRDRTEKAIAEMRGSLDRIMSRRK